VNLVLDGSLLTADVGKKHWSNAPENDERRTWIDSIFSLVKWKKRKPSMRKLERSN